MVQEYLLELSAAIDDDNVLHIIVFLVVKGQTQKTDTLLHRTMLVSCYNISSGVCM